MATIESVPGATAAANQPPPLPETNLFEADLALQEALAREGGGWGTARVRELGALAGSEPAREHAARAERNQPTLQTHDRAGERLDEVRCDPSWHWLLAEAVRRGVAALPWQEPRPGAHVVRVALGHLWGQLDTGVMCPLIMTFAAAAALEEFGGEDTAPWLRRLTLADYARGALAGQAFTERQGGSDLRATATRAEPDGDGGFRLWGAKWFCSAPMCDVFLTLARTDAGLCCFLIERGAGFRIVRLKDKLGTRSLPSAEVELDGVRGGLLGEEGGGLRVLVRNLSHARLGPAVAPEMRAALVQAIHYCRHRRAFGAKLAEQPAMRSVLADLALASEAATTVALRLAGAYEDYGSPFRRLATTVSEYSGCGRVTAYVAEAMQCLGGNGYSEPFGMARLLRDSAVHPIWEGSGNVVALDVLRVMARQPEALDAFLAECELARGGDPRLDAHLGRVAATLGALAASEEPQLHARRVAGELALALQASLLVRHAPAFVADAFCAGRLGPEAGRDYGTLPAGVDSAAIIERALPS
jgi:putative acyl-CoA dehydrogenase